MRCVGGRLGLPATSTCTPSSAPSGGRSGGARARHGHGRTGTSQRRAKDACQRRPPPPPTPLPLPVQQAGLRRVGQRRPMPSLCDAHRAPVQVVLGTQGAAALLLPAPRGAPSAGTSGEGSATAHSLRDGRRVHALPPPRGGGGDDEEMASQRLGADPAPTGRSGSPGRGHGRAEGEDT